MYNSTGGQRRNRKKFRRVRKSASWLEYDRQMEESEAQMKAEMEAQVSPYPAYEYFQFPRQRGLSYLDESLLRYVHEQQHGEDGCTSSDLEIVGECAAPESVTQALKALKRFRKRGLILPTDNGNGIYVRLPRVFRKVPEPHYWPDRRTWKPYVLIELFNIMRRAVTTTPPPYIRYTEQEISYQPGMTQGRIRVAFKLHRLDGGQGSYVRDEVAADKLGMTVASYRSYRRQLETLGYIVLIGYTRRNVARYRLTLAPGVGVNPEIRGSMLEFPLENGLKARRPRKINEASPNIFARQDGQLYWPTDGQHSSISAVDQNPIIPSGEGMTSSFLVQTESVDNKVGSREFVSPITPVDVSQRATTTNPMEVPGDPTTTNPVTVPGKRDWVAKFNQLDVAAALKEHYGVDITPRLARSVCGHMRRGTFTAAGLNFVLARLHVLPGEDNHIARRPESLEDLLKRYSFIRDHLTRSLRSRVREQLERDVKTLNRVESVVEQLEAFKNALWCWNWKSYASFVADRRNGDRRFAWVAAYYFHSHGEDVMAVDGGVAATFSCMCNPDVYDWAARHLKCDLADLTGVAKPVVVKLRATMLMETKSQLAEVTATSTPSFETLVEADVMGVEAQIARAIEGDGVMDCAA